MKQVGWLRCFAVLAVLSIFCPTPAFGRLAPSRLSDLISDSALIVQTSVIQLGTEIPGTRLPVFAVLRVQHVFKGTYDQETVRIEFEPEQHEQFITTTQYERLLFLKKTTDGKYTATQYGRSYWPLIWVEGAERKLATPYVYSTSSLSVPETLVKEAEVAAPELLLERRVKAIYLEDLIPLLGTEK